MIPTVVSVMVQYVPLDLLVDSLLFCFSMSKVSQFHPIELALELLTAQAVSFLGGLGYWLRNCVSQLKFLFESLKLIIPTKIINCRFHKYPVTPLRLATTLVPVAEKRELAY